MLGACGLLLVATQLIPGPAIIFILANKNTNWTRDQLSYGKHLPLQVKRWLAQPTPFPTQLIPDPTTLQGEAFNLHNAGSGISSGCSLHEDGIMRCDVQHNQKLSRYFEFLNP